MNWELKKMSVRAQRTDYISMRINEKSCLYFAGKEEKMYLKIKFWNKLRKYNI